MRLSSPSDVQRQRGPSRTTLVAALLGGVGILGAVLLGSPLLVVLIAVLVLAVATTAEAKRAGRRWRRGEFLVRGASFACLNLGGALVRRVIRPDYVFVLYAETDRDKRLYFPRWVERLLRPVFPSGLIHFGRYWGMMVAGKATAETFESSPDRLRALLDNTRERFPHVQVIALAGRLPSIAAAQGVSLDGPFLDGDRGTLCAMMGAAHEQAELLGKTPSEVSIAVPGGDGFIGRQLVVELAREFREVIALDPRLEEDRGWRNNVLFTHRPEDVARAQAVLVLTARGEETADVVPYLAPGTVVADDTHPEIPESLRERMVAAGVTVLKASVGDRRCRIRPRIPIFRSDDIPGCLLEALVVVHRGKEVLASQAAFNAAAREIGFRARLAPHISSRRRAPSPT